MSAFKICKTSGCGILASHAFDYCQACLTKKASPCPGGIRIHQERLPSLVTPRSAALPKPKPFDDRFGLSDLCEKCYKEATRYPEKDTNATGRCPTLGCGQETLNVAEYCQDCLIKKTLRNLSKDTTNFCKTPACCKVLQEGKEFCSDCLTAKTNPNAGGIMHGCKTPSCGNITQIGEEFCTMCQLAAQDKEQREYKLSAPAMFNAPKPFDWRKLHGRKMEVLVGVDIAQGVDTQVVTLYDPKTKEFFVISSRQKGDNPK